MIVNRRGYALVDTSARVRGTESFKSRPEIAQALLGKYPHGVRNSKTLHERLLYVAVPIAANGKVHGAVRVTYPYSAVDSRIRRYWLLLALIGVVVLAGAAVVGLGLARFVTRPLRGLEDAAAAVGEGHLDARASEQEGPPEVPLARGSLQRDRREAVTASSLAGRVRRRRLARAADAVDRAPAAAGEPAVEPGPRRRAARGRSAPGSRRRSARAWRARTPAAEASARVDASRSMRERVEAWRRSRTSIESRSSRSSMGRCRCVRRRGASPRSSTTSSPTRSRRRRTAARSRCRPSLALRRGSSCTSVTTARASPAEQRERAFDRFWRAGLRRGRLGAGAGDREAARRRGRRRGRIAARQRAAAWTPSSACVLPEPLPKLAHALSRRLPVRGRRTEA